MKLRFSGNLDFQMEAIEAIVGLFETQGFLKDDLWEIDQDGVIPNRLNIDQETILKNLNSVQRKNKIAGDKKLYGMNFSVEMETGTGKTYVYLRTIYELNNRYGFKKFIIVVPSIAISEGVLKTLRITENHFKNLYDGASCRYYKYSSKQINQIRQFARSGGIEVMVITIDAFNKNVNIMNQERDDLQGQRPIDMIKKSRPILILDEPQNMESAIAKESLEKLKPLFALRYSATHKNPYNLTYRLDPVEAIKKRLVKKIEVASVTDSGDYNAAPIQCIDIVSTSNSIKAKLRVNKNTSSGTKATLITVKNGDRLEQKTNNSEYSEYVVNEIDYRYNYIKFSNGLKIGLGEVHGKDRKQLIALQIKHAVEVHFQKFKSLKSKGVKPITLFFIDKVDNYNSEKGFIRQTFEREFNVIKHDYSDFRNKDVKQIHAGYFSKKSTERSMKKDKDVFDLIMRDKERLLSFDEPVQFIFSHSALREGWDNPNVFTICTLNPTISTMKKRQEIGRGMRLPVNQKGDRVVDGEHVLTIVANESYEEYAKQLQSEYIEEYGNSTNLPKPGNRRDRTTLKLKKSVQLHPKFSDLWGKIGKKTRYGVRINSAELVKHCIDEINKMTVNTIKIQVEKVELDLDRKKGVVTKFVGKSSVEATRDYTVPDIVSHIAIKTSLTRATIIDILTNIENLELVFNNPQEFVTSCTTIIKEKLADFLVNGVEYIKVNEWYRMELFGDINTYRSCVVDAEKSIYSAVACDSDVEKTFAEELEKMKNVKFFVKLPNWFIVETPIGKYNPDWAIVIDDTDEYGNVSDVLYIVAETKGSLDWKNLRDVEKRKIRCGERHFTAINTKYKVVTKPSEL